MPNKERRDHSGVAGVLIALAAVIHATVGVAALAGAPGLEANVREIESNPDFGELYLGLGAWGAILLAVGLAELAAAAAIARRGPNRWLAAIMVAFLGLIASFFSLAIFRVPCLVAVVILLAAVYVLSYHSRRDGRDG